MKFFQKRSVALAIAVLTFVGATTGNINLNLRRQAQQAEALWEERSGPAQQLETRRSAAVQLCSVLSGYPELEQEAAELRRVCQNWPEPAEPASAGSANAALDRAAQAAYAAALEAPLSSRDRENAEYYYGLLENAGRVLEESGYNDAVTAYNALLEDLPLRLLRPLVFVEAPAYFEARGGIC